MLEETTARIPTMRHSICRHDANAATTDFTEQRGSAGDRDPIAADLPVSALHRRPGDAMSDLLAAPELAPGIARPGVVEGLAENILCVGRQMGAHAQREILVCGVGHGCRSSAVIIGPGKSAELSCIKAPARPSQPCPDAAAAPPAGGRIRRIP